MATEQKTLAGIIGRNYLSNDKKRDFSLKLEPFSKLFGQENEEDLDLTEVSEVQLSALGIREIIQNTVDYLDLQKIQIDWGIESRFDIVDANDVSSVFANTIEIISRSEISFIKEAYFHAYKTHQQGGRFIPAVSWALIAEDLETFIEPPAVNDISEFLVDSKIASLVFDYIIDEERVHVVEPLSKEVIKELNEHVNADLVIQQLGNNITEFVLNLIINCALESELLGASKKVLIDCNNEIASDFGNSILNEYRTMPAELGEFVELISLDVRRLASQYNFSGDWGVLEIDDENNDVVIRIPDDTREPTVYGSQIEVHPFDELP